MTEETPQEAAKILTKWLNAIKQQEKKKIPAIEQELGEEIGLSGHTIESWRSGKRQPDSSQVVSIAKEIIRRLKAVEQEDFFQFLRGFGHLSPSVVWDELHFSRKVDVPAAEEHFVRHDQKITELIRAVKPGEIVSLCGPGGVGKTALVIAAIQQLASDPKLAKQFPDGILYYNFYGGYTIDDACHYILKFFGTVIPENPKNYREAVREVLRERQGLLVLDGAEEVDNLGDLLRIHRDNGVLIVTRYRHAAQRPILYLEPPPLTIAISILQAWSTEVENPSEFHAWRNDQPADLEAVTEICELLGRLPLALRLAGRYMLHRTSDAQQFLKWLKEWHRHPLLLHEGPHQHDQSVMILMEKSLEAVCQEKGAEDARNVLAVIGLLSYTPFNLEVIASVLERSPSFILESIGALTKFSMVKWVADKRYQAIHRLIHTYAHKHLTVPDWVLVFLAGYYIRLAKEQRQLGQEGNAWLDAERPHLMVVLANCVDHEEWIAVNELGKAIGEYLYLRGYLVDCLTVYASALKAAQALGDRESEGIWLGNLGNAYYARGQMFEALENYLRALAIAEEFGDRKSAVTWLGHLGTAYHNLGQIDMGIKSYLRALPMALLIGDRRGESNLLGYLGNAYRDLGQYQQAFQYYSQAITIAWDIGDEQGIGNILHNLGYMCHIQGEYQWAIKYYTQACTVSRMIGDRLNECRSLGGLGDIQHILGNAQAAISTYKAALMLVPDDALIHNHLASVYLDLRQIDKAVHHFQPLSDLRPEDALKAHVSLGVIARCQGNETEAQQQFDAALWVWFKARTKKVQSLFDFLENKAFAHLGLNQMEEALDTLKEALEKRQPGDVIRFTLYDLLAEATNPLQGLAEMRRLMVEAQEKEKKR